MCVYWFTAISHGAKIMSEYNPYSAWLYVLRQGHNRGILNPNSGCDFQKGTFSSKPQSIHVVGSCPSKCSRLFLHFWHGHAWETSGRSLETHRFPSTVKFKLVAAESLKGAISYIFNPCLLGLCGAVGPCCWPGGNPDSGGVRLRGLLASKGRSNFRLRRLMVVKINTLPSTRGKGLESL